MSSSTGTRKARNVETRATDALTEIDKDFINGFKVFSNISSPVAGSAGGAVGSISNTATGNFLAKKGDFMIGPLALDPPTTFSAEVDSNNTLDIGPFNDNPQFSSNIQLDDLQPNSAILDIIANPQFDGQILLLRTFAPTVAYTLRQGTVGNGGNIQTGDGNDLTVGDLQTVFLIYDDNLVITVGGTWRVVSISNATGGGGEVFTWSNDHSAAGNDLTNLGRLRFNNALALVSNADPSITLNLANHMQFNVADQNDFNFSMDGVIRFNLQQSGVNNDSLLAIQTNIADASALPIIVMTRDDPTPSNDTEFGRLDFQGTNALSSGGVKIDTHLYGRILVEYENVVEGREASSMAFVTSFDTGAVTQFTPFFGINLQNSGKIDVLKDIDMTNNRMENLDTLSLRDSGTIGTILFDADEDSDTFISNNASDPDRIDVTVNTVNGFLFGYSTTKAKMFAGFTLGGFGFLNVADTFAAFDPITEPADAQLVNGEGLVYFDNTLDPAVLTIKKKDSVGAVSVVSLEAGGGGANVGLTNLVGVAINTSLLPVSDGAIDLGSASFAWDDTWTEKLKLEIGGTVTNNQNMLFADSLGMSLNVPDGDKYTFMMNGDPILFIEEDEIMFAISGKLHRINATTTALQLVAQNTTDTVEILNNPARSNPTVEIDDGITNFKTTTSQISPYTINIVQNNDTPAVQRTIGSLAGVAENSLSVDTEYANIEFSTSNSITSGFESGRIQIEVKTNGATVPIIECAGNTASSTGRLGFFGVSEVDKQSVASDTLANLYTALRNYGLIV